MAGSYVFSTPAQQGPKDYALAGRDPAAFQQDWSDNIGQWTAMAIIGNPWSNQNDAPRAWYFNPAVSGWPQGSPTPVQWTPFPNRLPTFFLNAQIVNGQQLGNALSPTELYTLADTNAVSAGGKTWVLYDPDPTASDILQIPATKCPQIDWSGSFMPFSPYGPRGWLDEYCEWSIVWKDNEVGGTIQQIMFTCENPAYWLTLWNRDPEVVLALYQHYVDPAVRLSDLYLTYPPGSPNAGQPVIDPTTGNPAYNPTNRWNSGTQRIPGQSGGAIHLTSPPNTLSAEIYLAAASTIQRSGINVNDRQALICCSQYGQSFRNSDPNIGFAGNRAASRYLITLADPVGLYIQTPNWTQFQTPDGSPIQDCWTVTRGETNPNGTPGDGTDSILHAVFEVPPDRNFTINDIKAFDPLTNAYRNISSAGQIAQNFKIALRIDTMPPSGTTPPNTPMACVTDQPTAELQPWPAQLVPATLFYGASPTDLPSRLARGATIPMALVVQGASADTTTANARIQFDNPGVSAEVTDYVANAGAIPGLTNSGGTQAFLLNVTVAADAATGPLGIRALNPWEGADPTVEQHSYEQGLTMVV